MIDWDRLIEPIEKKLSELKGDKSPAGRKGFDLIVIVKCFILQMIYDLSDARLFEEC